MPGHVPAKRQYFDRDSQGIEVRPVNAHGHTVP